MSYLKNNNNKVVVDAILTDYGKTKLAAQGKLDIYKFAIADDEIDYELYNTNHPQGTDYYDSAIVNMPTLQALPKANESMKYPLFTPSSSQPLVVEDMTLTYDSDLISGVTDNRVFSITPSISPSPSDLTQVYFAAIVFQYGSKTGETYILSPVINPDIGVTQSIINTRNAAPNIAGAIRGYAVGHAFTFRALIPPLTSGDKHLTILVIPFNTNARPKSINILIKNKSQFSSPIAFVS